MKIILRESQLRKVVNQLINEQLTLPKISSDLEPIEDFLSKNRIQKIMIKGEIPDEIKGPEIPKLPEMSSGEFLDFLSKSKIKAKAFHITDSGYKFPIYPVSYSEGFKGNNFTLSFEPFAPKDFKMVMVRFQKNF